MIRETVKKLGKTWLNTPLEKIESIDGYYIRIDGIRYNPTLSGKLFLGVKNIITSFPLNKEEVSYLQATLMVINQKMQKQLADKIGFDLDELMVP